MAEKLEQMHLLGDPFSDTITDIKAWYMIHMHDEVQCAVHPSLVPITVFETEEEAKAFRSTDKFNSAVGHGKKYFIGRNNPVVQCIHEAIEDAVKILKLKVPLGFEWNAGKNWAQCH